MKKFLTCLLIVLLATIFVGCNNKYSYKQNLTTYTMDLVYEDSTKTLSGNQTVDYINTSDNVLSCIKFHLYPNAFRQGAKKEVVSLSNVIKAYPNGKSYGNINIINAQIGSNDVEYFVCGEDENILQINLNEELYPNERVRIIINYTVKLANINHRLGYGENAINLCNFYPIACVYEDDDFVCDLYNSNGDPFYSQVADYNVTLTYPNKFTLASTGEFNTTNVNNDICANIEAKCVRDFAIVLSSNFKQKTSFYNEGRVNINYFYYNDKTPEQTLVLINKALCFFEEKIGKYPYNQISIVETNFVHGGMEYPNLVLISDNIADYTVFQTVVVHELCHQWWYGVVGNNQYDYGWIDEGLTEFSTVYFFDKHPEYQKTMENLIQSATYSYTTFMKVYTDVQGEVDTSMNRSLNEFNTEPEYVYNTYVKGMLMFSTIYEVVGEKNFSKALKHYYENNLYKVVTPQDVIKYFSSGTGKNLQNLINSWIQGKVKIIAK